MESKIDKLAVSAFQVPTDGPESDGTLQWDKTVMVLVELQAGTRGGLGYTYASKSTAQFIRDKLQPLVLGTDALDIQKTWDSMVCAVRNFGHSGLSAMAIAAVDVALWDLKARLLELPLVKLLGQVRQGIAAYGSGGFTSYSLERLQEQLGNWAREGLGAVKMKIGREPDRDRERIRAAREAIGPRTDLFVDANGAYSPKPAVAQAERFAEFGVSWYEEPVVAADLAGLRFVRQGAPASMVVAAGEYGFQPIDFHRLLKAEAVDVLQADATRCAGITGFLRVGALCEAFMTPLSAHTAPSIHQHPCCALPQACNVEYFYDHYRIEQMFFEGAAAPAGGQLRPDLSRQGLGLELKHADARRYAV